MPHDVFTTLALPRLAIRETVRLTDATLHYAFTDICQWHDQYYCAYRTAQTHHPTPRGYVEIQRQSRCGETYWYAVASLSHPLGDVRDPRFLVTPGALYVMCGVYLPSPQYRHRFEGLSLFGGDNTLVTHLAYTTDGDKWSELVPILRPNHWGWSAVQVGKAWVMAAYATGTTDTETSSIVVYSGWAPGAMKPLATIYDGASFAHEGAHAIYRATSPSEPVLYVADNGHLACVVRTEAGMAQGIGTGKCQGDDWHWWTHHERLHPSAVLSTPYGRLLAARTLPLRRTQTTTKTLRLASDTPSTDLYLMHGQHLKHLLRLPSAGDCGYAGMCTGSTPETVLVSYYSQHETPRGLPGAAVYVATIDIAKE